MTRRGRSPAWRRVTAAALLMAFAALAPPDAPRAQDPPSGALRGRIHDADGQSPIGRARVTIVETSMTVVTAPDGAFLFQRVPAGRYTLILVRDGYERELIPGIIVREGEMAEVRAEMRGEIVELEELLVEGHDLATGEETGMLEIRAGSLTIQDAVSADTIGKAGASDVAGALKLVVGASVTEGKYATVRGLSDRYTGTTLNGVRVPSADPRRRAVQVDLFPTGTIENLTVTKTFTPDLQGDFTGGGVDIRTRSVPDARFYSLSYGVESNSGATGNDGFLTYRGARVDFFGIAGAERDLSAEGQGKLPGLPSASFTPTATRMADAVTWDQHVRSFSPVMGVSRQEPGGNSSFSLQGGSRYEIGEDRNFGLLGALTRSHKYDFYEGGQNNSFSVGQAGDPLVLGAPRHDSAGVEEVLIGFLGSASYQAGPKHAYGLQFVANQSAEDEARFQETQTSTVEQNQSLHYTERRVSSAQLHGTHVILDFGPGEGTVEWFAARNETRQEEPDVRFFRNIFDPISLSARQPSNTSAAENSRRIFREIGEDGQQAGVDVKISFPWRNAGSGEIKAGVFLDRTERAYEQDSFYYVFPTQAGASANDARAENLGKATFVADHPGDLWTDVFLEPGNIGLAGNRCASPPSSPSRAECAAGNQLLWVLEPNAFDVDYDGRQEIRALYAMTELPLSRDLRLIGGVRYESTLMEIDPTGRTGRIELVEVQQGGDRGLRQADDAEGKTTIDEGFMLPSVGVVYDLRPNMHLRASWSRTFARPTFREMAPVASEEFLAGDEFVGNKDLKMSSITNYDLRWEWFRRPGEVLSASVFTKDLEDPIELISFFAGGRNFVQPVNYESGRVRGMEVEARVPLGPAGTAMAGLVGGASFTLIDSEVDVPPLEQAALETFGLGEATRRLQGQPEYLASATLSWDNDSLGAAAGIFYTVVGDSLLSGAAKGDNGTPNVFETSYETLDLSYTQTLRRLRGLSISFKAKNLLRPHRMSVFRAPDGQEVVKKLRETTTTFGVTLGMKW